MTHYYYLVLLILLQTALACIDSNCIDCISYIQNYTILQRCNQCIPNYVINSAQVCAFDLIKILIFIACGVVLMICSFILRAYFIKYNTRKPPIYTAEYQQEMFDFMTKKNRVEPAAERDFIAKTQRGLILKSSEGQQDSLNTCNWCNKHIQYRNKIVDTFCKCKHQFHSLCLKGPLLNQYNTNPHLIYGHCPTCRRRIYNVSIYCQICMLQHREVQINEVEGVMRLYSFTCFRCQAKRKKQKIQRQANYCCGYGKYVCCHSLKY